MGHVRRAIGILAGRHPKLKLPQVCKTGKGGAASFAAGGQEILKLGQLPFLVFSVVFSVGWSRNEGFLGSSG